jgi:hypothetical protein
MAKALAAYDEISVIATRVQDASSLAKIIDSKINLIERLAQARININSQLDTISRSKAEQLDRLDYTYFHVNVSENKFIDGKNLKTSWELALKEFVRNTNQTLQDITINLVGLLLLVIQYLIYLLILLVVAKYGWKFAKRLWFK